MEEADTPVRLGGRRNPSPLPGSLRGVLPVDADQHPTASSPESGTPAPCLPPGSAVSALQSKVKALSKHRPVGKERDNRGQPARSSHTHGDRKLSPVLPGPGSPPTCRSWHCSSDDEGESQLQDHTHPWDHLTPHDMEVQREVVGEDEGEGRATSSSSSLPWEASEEFSVEILQEGPSSKPRSPRKGFPRPGTPPTNGGAPLVEESPNSEPAGSLFVWRELQRSDSLESHLRRYWEGETDLAAPLGGLWRADSWESVCSGGGALSLAERVEMNRAILRQMLNKPRSKDAEGLEQRPKQNGNKAALNDSDWDSGISLQDGEHCTRYSSDCRRSCSHPRGHTCDSSCTGAKNAVTPSQNTKARHLGACLFVINSTSNELRKGCVARSQLILETCRDWSNLPLNTRCYWLLL